MSSTGAHAGAVHPSSTVQHLSPSGAPSRLRVRWGRVSVYVAVLLVLPISIVAGTRHAPATQPAPVVPAARPVAGSAPRAGCGKPSSALTHQAPALAKRTVALTFDDGPGRNTRAVLAILKRQHVHATFFMIGNLLAGRRETARLVLSSGHTIGNHSETHPFISASVGWDAHDLRRELTTSQRTFVRQLGITPCFFRPPGGVVRGARTVARQQDLSIVLWSVDTRDWADRRASGVLRKADAGLAQEHPVILLHDGGSAHSSTVDALPEIIDAYRARGYVFVTIDGRT